MGIGSLPTYQARERLLDLRQMAAQRGYEIVHEYTDRISGAKAPRPGLDELITQCFPTTSALLPRDSRQLTDGQHP